MSLGLNETSRSPSPIKESFGKKYSTRTLTFERSNSLGSLKAPPTTIVNQKNLLDSVDLRNDTFGSGLDASGSLSLKETSILKVMTDQPKTKVNKKVSFEGKE